MVPSAATSPRRSSSTRVHSSSTRFNWCELRITDVPRSARRRMVSFMRRMPAGSSPVSGSSRIRTAGSCSRAAATESFCFMPRDSSLGRTPLFSVSSISASNSGILAAASGTPYRRAVKRRCSSTVRYSKRCGSSGMKARRRFASTGATARSKPAMLSVPVVGRRMPASARSVVVFPAPLGPTNPRISPCGTSRFSPRTADTAP